MADNELNVDKRGKLILHFDDEFRTQAESLPTSRYRPLQDTTIGLDARVEVWKALRPFIDSGDITPSPGAKSVLNGLSCTYREHRRAIRKAQNQYKHNVPNNERIPGIKSSPYMHQIRAFGFASMVPASALLMEQGTGKTLVSLGVIHHRYVHQKINRVLVVCPRSVIPVWPRELSKHADFEYSWDRVPKSTSASIRQDFGPGIQILIVNYDKLQSRSKEIYKWNPEMIILDESHRIKNRTTKRAKRCHVLGDQVKYKLILTGTPLGQKLIDAWSQYRFLNSDVFGKHYGNFQDQFCEMGGYMGHEIKGYKNLEHFSELLHSVAFRCSKKECLDLPAEINQNLYIEPSPKTKKIYDNLAKEFSADIDGDIIEVERAISLIVKLRQITGGIVRNEDNDLIPVAEEKLSTLRDFMENHPFDQKVVVATSFTHEIHCVEKLCEELGLGYLVLDGSTPEEERFSIETRFREEKKILVLIMQVNTGGEGLDFTPADTMIFYSPTFSFTGYWQVRSRIHRLGQAFPCNYLHLLMEGTIDEKIMNFLETYGDLTSQILDNLKGYNLAMSSEEMKKALDEVEADITKRKLNRRDKMAKAKTKTEAKKTKTKTAAKKTERVVDGYTASNMAEELGIESTELRKALRSLGIQKPTNSWTWGSKKEAADVLKQVKQHLKNGGSASKEEGSTKSKGKAKAKAKAGTKTKTKAKKTTKKAKKVKSKETDEE